MLDKNIRKLFGKRLKALRNQKKWTQKELAGMLNIGFSQYNKYELGLHIPPIEKLIQLVQLLDTTLDYLLIGDSPNGSSLHNTRLFRRFQALEDFDEEDKGAIIKVLDAMIMKHKMEGAMSPLDGTK